MKPVILGITGTIASGKTVFTQALGKLGFEVLNADKIIADLCKKDHEGYKELLKLKIPGLINKKGELNKEVLRELVFNDARTRKRVEHALHPLAIKAIEKRFSELEKGAKLAVEIPLLYEANMEGLFDYTIVVYRNESKVIDSVSKKYGIDHKKAKNLLGIQMSCGEKILLADILVINNGTVEDLNAKAKRLCSLLSLL